MSTYDNESSDGWTLVSSSSTHTPLHGGAVEMGNTPHGIAVIRRVNSANRRPGFRTQTGDFDY